MFGRSPMSLLNALAPRERATDVDGIAGGGRRPQRRVLESKQLFARISQAIRN